jgi:hypothetical protein
MKRNVRLTFHLILTGLIICSILSCKKHSTSTDYAPKPDPAILGLWSHYFKLNSITVKYYLRFKNSGKFDAAYSEDSLDLVTDYGSFSTNGNEIVMIDADNAPNSVCKSMKGIYTYSFQGNTMILTTVSDTCYTRSYSTPGLWTKN